MPKPARPVSQMFEKLAGGKCLKQVAAEEGISYRRASFLVHREAVKMGAKNLLQAVLLFDRKKR